MWRRLKIIEFPMDFRGNMDKEMDMKLRGESQGILAALVKACLLWQTLEGLNDPEEIIAAVQEYRDQMDPLKEFIEEKCLLAPDMTATSGDIYHAYKSWAEDNLQSREKLTKRNLGLCLGEKGFRKGKGTGGVRLWRGLGLRTLIE